MQDTPQSDSVYSRSKIKCLIYARLRNVRLRPASPVGVGALFPAAEAVVDVAVFFTFVGAWFRAVAGFFAAVVEAAVAFRAPVPVLVGLTTVVPEEALEERLFLRSTCLVAGRGRGDFVPFVPVPVLLPGRPVCEGCLPLVVVALAPLFTELFARSGLEGLRGEIGLDR